MNEQKSEEVATDFYTNEPKNPQRQVVDEVSSYTTISKPNKKPRFIFLFVFLLLILAVISFLFIKNQTGERRITNILTPKRGTVEKNYSNWINCDDIRSVIEDGNNIYASCLGGVLVVDRNTGKVVDQIGEPDGLGDATTTSLVKKGRQLYIGTQDGLTIFDLDKRTVTKISVREGLANGANIVLKEDGDNLWVGTFDGLSLLDTKDCSIKNFTNELADNSTKFNVREILVTNKSVYFIVLASALSAGSIARYDKAAGSWERFGPSDFGVTGDYARIDFFKLLELGGKIYLSDNHDFWVSDNAPRSEWKKLDLIRDTAGIEYATMRIIAQDDNSFYLVHSNGNIYKYIPENDNLEVIYDEKSDKNLVGASFIPSNNSMVWFQQGNEDIPNLWLRWLDLKTKQGGSIFLQDRPAGFQKLFALIDNNPIILGDSGIWNYNSETRTFTPLFKIGALYTDQDIYLDPVAGASKIFMFRQSCGMGCGLPEFLTLDYSNGVVEKLIIPENITNEFKQDKNFVDYPGFKLIWKNYERMSFIFRYSSQGDEIKYLMVDLGSKSMGNVNKVPEDGETVNTETKNYYCDASYLFTGNGNKFSSLNCGSPVESQNYSWRVDKFKTVLEMDKKTGIEKELILPGPEEPYSPFGTKEEHRYDGIMLANEKVYVWGNRGLNVLDTKNGKWELIDTKRGLLRNEVTEVLVGSKFIWVTSRWGGLSLIPN